MGRIVQFYQKAINTAIGFLVLSLAIGTPLQGQNLIDPITGSTTQFGQINSDYGPRAVVSGTNPHIGIDYQLYGGNKAYAVEDGQIDDICLSCGTPYIRIGNWRYIHLLTTTTADMTWEAKTLSANPNYPPNANIIIQRSIVGGVLNTIRVLSDVQFNQPYLDPLTNQLISVENSVNAGDWIFTSNNLDNHLHIDYGPPGQEGWENPLRYIAHTDSHLPTVLMSLQRNVSGTAQLFADSAVYGNPMFLSPLQNVTIDKDFNEMSLYIKEKGQAESFITSYNYEHYGLNGIPIYVISNSVNIMASTNEGIYPFTPYPSQDFFKYHFYSRKDGLGNNAMNNLETLYPDGRYIFRACGKDVSGNAKNFEKQVILDNFKPFIRGITISSDHLLYSAYGSWDQQGDVFSWTTNPLAGYSSGLIDVNILVHTSEPMRELTIDLDNSIILSLMPDRKMIPVNAYRTEWSFTIPYAYLHQAIANGFTGFRNLRIEGNDYAGNGLFSPNYPGTTNGAAFPHRNNDGSWSPYSKSSSDDKHGFYLGINTNPGLLDAEFLSMTTSGTSPLSLQFVNFSAGQIQQWEWNFGNGMLWNGQLPPPVDFINNSSQAKTYSVSLKVSDINGATDTEYRTNYITVYPQGSSQGLSASFTFDQQNLGAPSLVDFINTSSGNGLSYLWDFDDGSSSSAVSPSHLFTTPGYYDVTLSITDVDGFTDQVEQSIFVYTSFSSGLNVDFSVSNPAVAGDFTRFEDLCSGGPSYAKKLWDFGDGFLQEVMGIPMHLYYSPGVYQVRLEVRDYLDNIIGVTSKNVTVIPNALNDLSTDLDQLVAKDAWWDDMFGRAVALDGDWAFIGAPYDDDNGSESGSVYIYRLDKDSVWNFTQKIKAKVATSKDYFGHSLACSANCLVVGAPGNSKYTNGKAVFFQYDGYQWVETQSISSPSSSLYHFGWDADMDGPLACISAPNSSKTYPGAAWVFRLVNGTWVNEAMLSDPLASGQDRFGMDISISQNHIATCIPASAAPDQIWFWEFNGKAWTVSKKINIGEASSVDIDCPWAVCGDAWNDRAIVYQFDNGSWQFDSYIYPEDGAQGTDDFGDDVSIAGRYILVGKPGDDAQNPDCGSAYLFRMDYYGYWQQHRKLMPASGEEDENFGWKIALSDNHALVGAYGWKGYRGSAYVYTNVTEPCDRLHKWCLLELYHTDNILDESGQVQMAGKGCDVGIYPGAKANYFAKQHSLEAGFTAWEGSEVSFYPVDCSLAAPGSFKECNCSFPAPIAEAQDRKSEPNFIIYPNPSSGIVRLFWDHNDEQVEARIIDADGRLVFQHSGIEKEEMIDLSSIRPGTYTLELRFSAGTEYRRWVKI